MKVSRLIEILQTQNRADEDIMVLWWEKHNFDYADDDERTLTNEAWATICDEFDDWDTAGDEIGQWIHSGVIDWSTEK